MNNTEREKIVELQIDLETMKSDLAKVGSIETKVDLLLEKIHWYNGVFWASGALLTFILSIFFFVGNSWRESKDKIDADLQQQITAISNRVVQLEVEHKKN